MSIQKKSLISTLKTAKKANVASAPLTHVEGGTNEKKLGRKFAKVELGRKFAKVEFGKKFAKVDLGRKFAKR